MGSHRTTLNKMMAVAPLVLVATIGFKGRTAHSDFVFPEFTPTEEARISAYQPVAKKTEAAMVNGYEIPAAKCRELAKIWIAGAKSGELQPIHPTLFEDSMRDGLKSDILRDNMAVAESMNNVVQDDMAHARYDLAGQDVMLAAKTLEVIKYSDFTSLTACGMIQRRSILEAKEILPKLSPAGRETMLNEAKDLKANVSVLRLMALRERDLLLQYQVRKGIGEEQLDDIRKQVKPQELIDVKAVVSMQKEIARFRHNEGDELTPELLSDVRLGYVSAVDTDRKLNSLVGDRTSSVTL